MESPKRPIEGDYYKSKTDGDILKITGYDREHDALFTHVYQDINSVWGNYIFRFGNQETIVWTSGEIADFLREYTLANYINTPLYKVLNG